MHIAIDYYLHSVEPQRRLSEVFYFVERARTHTPPPRFFFSLSFFCVSAITVFESCGGEQFHPFLSLSLSFFHFLFRARTLVTHHSRVHPHQCICHVAASSCRPRRNNFFFKFATAKTPASVVFRKGTRTSCRSPLFSASRSTILLSEARNISA